MGQWREAYLLSWDILGDVELESSLGKVLVLSPERSGLSS